MTDKVDKETVERFEKAIQNLRENDKRHRVPKFLKQKEEPVEEVQKLIVKKKKKT